MAIPHHLFPSPAFVLDENRLRSNLELLAKVQEQAGIDIILAFKGFAMWQVFPIVREYLPGATASSLHEARLCWEEMGVRAHTYSPAYHPEEFANLLDISSHITFNSLSQYRQFRQQVHDHAHPISMGLRINPEYSDVETELYNPASPQSRLGELKEALADGLPEDIEGLHFHVLCESDSQALEKTLAAVEDGFGHLLGQLKWINMGGGHLMTREGYDTDHLIQLLRDFRQCHQLDIILEPGSAIAWRCGELIATVLDIVEKRGMQTAILDVSFTAHMPDTLEMPYKPTIIGATDPVAGRPSYRMGGTSCLAGDYMSAYSFEKPLQIGDRLLFEDMIHYTMVKTTTFNGVKHPSIALWTRDGQAKILREFGYEDFKNRLS
ncbi:MAG: carboxynorspermidine decarboxylase [Bacteroidota bacterium]